MIRVGQVLQVDGDILKVRIGRLESCKSCGMCDGGRQESIVFIKGKANPGDIVDVFMPDAKVLKVSAITYVMPLLGLVGGLAAGTAMFPQGELAALAVGLAGLGLGFGAVKIADRRVSRFDQWQPRIIAVRAPDPDAGELEKLSRCDPGRPSVSHY